MSIVRLKPQHGNINIELESLQQTYNGFTQGFDTKDLRDAKTLLEETNDKISSIAMDCGYSSLSAFYESFQQKLGVSPAVYRKGLYQHT